jgi:hypothetical protein
MARGRNSMFLNWSISSSMISKVLHKKDSLDGTHLATTGKDQALDEIPSCMEAFEEGDGGMKEFRCRARYLALA